MDLAQIRKLREKYLKPILILALYKIVQGILELVGAYILLSLSYDQIHNLALRLTREELFEDPRDIFVSLLFKYLPLLANYQEQAGFILLLVGLYDVITGIGLFFAKNWARLIILIILIISLPLNFYNLITRFDVLKLVFFIIQAVFIPVLWKYKPTKK